MPLQVSLEALCEHPAPPSTPHCIRLPGGAEVCPPMPGGLIPTPMDEILRPMFDQANAALAPMKPIFDIIGVLQAVIDTFKAVAKLDPKEIIESTQDLAEGVAQVAAMLPPLSVPVLILDVLACIEAYLIEVVQRFKDMQAVLARIEHAAKLASRPGNEGLVIIVDCARADVDAMLASYNAGLEPLNRIIGLFNYLLCLIGIKDGIPTLASAASGALDPAITVLEGVLVVLGTIRKLVPLSPAKRTSLADRPC